MLKKLAPCVRTTFVVGVIQIILGVYLIGKEIISNTFIVHESMGTLFVAIGIGLLFNVYVKSLGMAPCEINQSCNRKTP